MSAYVVGHITVKDADKWVEYRSRVPATLEPWGAEVVFRGCRAVVLDGEYRHTDTVVLRFPDKEAARNWHDSDAYQALVPLRKEAAEVELIGYDEE
jgi:uncharacterized protein (DUF1330 family)